CSSASPPAPPSGSATAVRIVEYGRLCGWQEKGGAKPRPYHKPLLVYQITGLVPLGTSPASPPRALARRRRLDLDAGLGSTLGFAEGVRRDQGRGQVDVVLGGVDAITHLR